MILCPGKRLVLVSMQKLLLIFLGSVLLSGCTTMTSVELDREAPSRRPYLSEIDLPEAKAWYAYAQFRMLIVDNRWDDAIAALQRARAFDPSSVKLRMTLAKAYLHNQQLEEGGAELETLLREHPERTDGWELLGELRGYQERFSEAAVAYRRVLEQEPKNEALRLRLIAVYDQQGEVSGALAEARVLLEQNPESLPGRLALARLQRRNQQTGDAIKTYRDLLVQRPGQLQAILELGLLLEKEQQVGEAIDLYQESIKDNPELLAVYKQLARILILQERYAEALQLLERAQRQRPDDIQILTRIGLLQLSREDYVRGEQSFRKILALQPESQNHLYSLGMALVGQHRDKEALAVFASIKRDAEVYPDAVLQIGYLYRQEGDLERGIATLQQAIEQGDGSVELFYYLSAFLGEAERYAAAGKVVRKGLESHPREARLHYQLGVIYERLDDRNQALAQMEKVLEIEPLDADALNFIAYHFAEKGENLEQALVQAKQALEQKQTSYIYDTLGWVYYRMQRFEEARINLEKAIMLDAEDPLIHEHLGDTYVKQQQWRAAEEAYRKALDLGKDSGDAAQKLEQLMKDHPR